MPRKAALRPGPKSKKPKEKHESTRNVRSFLGENSTAEDSPTESFRSADLAGQTDYGLEFTTSNTGTPRSSKRLRKGRSSGHVPSTAPSSSARWTAGKKKPASPAKGRRRKQRNPERLNARFWKTVGQLQKRTDNLIPRANFGRVIRELLIQLSSSATRVTYTALVALQEAAEMYLTSLFQDAYCCTLHRGRVTLSVKDMELVRYLRGVSDSGNL